MKRLRFTEEQIIGVLKEAEAGAKSGDTMLRAVLYKAAQSMLCHSQKWSWLKGRAGRPTQGNASRHRGARQEDRRYPPPYVGRWNRLPLEQRYRGRTSRLIYRNMKQRVLPRQEDVLAGTTGGLSS